MTLNKRFDPETGQVIYEQVDSDLPVVLTGPIAGIVTLPDGTTYDVTEAIIEVQPGHELLVSNAIGERHVAEGHPSFATEDHDFTFTPEEII
jgi:hypothetical protein